MHTTDDYYAASPADRSRMLHSHRGPDNWPADIATSNRRALAALAAMKHNRPRPTWGRHNAGANK